MKKDENVRLYAISVDPPDVSRTFVEKIESDGKGAISFPVLSDPDHKIITSYGLVDPAYEKQPSYGIPHPAVFVLDKSGKVVWAKVESNYKNRPSITEIRLALDASN